ncbi:MAG: FAD-dependent oxidoreductase [Acidobacteria bacterium]|jgi:quinone-modifying oxidoreductase, subunit QmoA|nr:FAD-dependent oxidoreductase [Acidobacteriota bacterium]
MNDQDSLPVLVVGAGVSGITAALEAAETGASVVLVERQPYVGGRVAGFYHYFPKMCPPSCGLEINVQRLERNPRVRVLTETRVSAAEQVDGGWRVTLERAPAYVTEACTGCGECSKVCPVSVVDEFNHGMSSSPAIRLSHPQAWPQRFVIERAACADGCEACVQSCAYDAIHLDATVTTEELQVGSVVLATGWQPYPLEKLSELGGGVLPDVISNVQMERLASPSGPTAGQILCPSTGQPPRRVAFVQCAGSRDVNHLPYCSGICCLASLKHAQYVKDQHPDTEVSIFYIDRRTPGRNEDVLTRIGDMDGVRLVKGKVGKVEAGDGGLVLTVEDVEAGRKLHEQADLVVLATGMVPTGNGESPFGIARDEDGFALDDFDRGLVVAGVARRPTDVAAAVRDATGSAARALAAAERGA